MKNIKVESLFIITLLGWVGAASAQTPISIANNSFESNVGGWPYGTYNGGSLPNGQFPGWSGASYAYSYAPGAALTGIDGTQAVSLGGYAYQTTAATFLTGATYTLSFELGRPTGAVADGGGISFGLYNPANSGFLSGANAFISFSSTPSGSVATYTLSYVALPTDAGNPVTVAFDDYYDGADSGINPPYLMDNVTLTVTPVPEPSSFALSVLGVSLLLLMSKCRSKFA